MQRVYVFKFDRLAARSRNMINGGVAQRFEKTTDLSPSDLLNGSEYGKTIGQVPFKITPG